MGCWTGREFFIFFLRARFFLNDYVRTHNFAHNFLNYGLIDQIRPRMCMAD